MSFHSIHTACLADSSSTSILIYLNLQISCFHQLKNPKNSPSCVSSSSSRLCHENGPFDNHHASCSSCPLANDSFPYRCYRFCISSYASCGDDAFFSNLLIAKDFSGIHPCLLVLFQEKCTLTSRVTLSGEVTHLPAIIASFAG